MNINPNRVAEIFEELEQIREKVNQVIRIEKELDKQKKRFIEQLRYHPSLISSLTNTYKREFNLISIVDSAIPTLKASEEILNELCREAGMVTNNRIAKRIQSKEIDDQSKVLLKYSQDVLKKYIESTEEITLKLKESNLSQTRILNEMKIEITDENFDELQKEYANDKTRIKRFYKEDAKRIYAKALSKIGVRKSKILIGVLNFPLAWVVQPYASYAFDVGMAILIPQILAAIKQAAVLVYVVSAYYKIPDKIETKITDMTQRIKTGTEIKTILSKADPEKSQR